MMQWKKATSGNLTNLLKDPLMNQLTFMSLSPCPPPSFCLCFKYAEAEAIFYWLHVNAVAECGFTLFGDT